VRESPIELRLKRDQVFGLHACVSATESDAFCALLDEAGVEFVRAWEGAARLHEPDCTTVLFFDEVDFVREAIANENVRFVFSAEIETLPPRYLPPCAVLLEAGQPRADAHADEPLDVLAPFAASDVPTLIGVLTDPELHVAPSDHPAIWAPIHALRALASLRAESAVAPALGLLRRIDENNDDWVGGEVTAALGRIGAPAIPSASAYLTDENHPPDARLAAARALGAIARAHPECRAACVDALVAQLDAHLVQATDFNGLLISALLDIPAPEAAPAIERAFASNRVNDGIAGDWEDVQIDLGLKLRRETPPKPSRWTDLGAHLRGAFGLPPHPEESDFAPLPAERAETFSLPYRAPPKVGRNDPCPCGSGRKFKKCCGA
jgi:hypothetical protein